MTLDEILDLWDHDSVIDPSRLATESLNEPKLHAKYWRVMVKEEELLRAFEAQEAFTLKEVREFYTQGPSSRQDWAKDNWRSFPAKGSSQNKSELQTYIDADERVLKIRAKIETQKIKVKVLTDIVRQIHARQRVIFNHIAQKKFEAG